MEKIKSVIQESNTKPNIIQEPKQKNSSKNKKNKQAQQILQKNDQLMKNENISSEEKEVQEVKC